MLFHEKIERNWPHVDGNQHKKLGTPCFWNFLQEWIFSFFQCFWHCQKTWHLALNLFTWKMFYGLQVRGTDMHYDYWESVTVYPSKMVSKNQKLVLFILQPSHRGWWAGKKKEAKASSSWWWHQNKKVLCVTINDHVISSDSCRPLC